MTFQFRPATRENTPLIIGLAGPTKSGKTNSAHRLAVGLANGGPVVMINSEGARGQQYADRFSYITTDITPPYRPERFQAALEDALALKPRPAVLIFDSMSHMHDGPGGLLEWHDAELDRLAGDDQKKRERNTWTAWIKPKAAENKFVYAMLEAEIPIILCFRAKEKLKIVSGRPPIDLGWQPIASERVGFETLFTLVLPPHCKGVPDLSISEMREPFDALIPAGKQLSEETGVTLARWAAGAAPAATTLTEETLNSLLEARTESNVSGEWLSEKLHAVGLASVPENVTLATIKRLSESQGLLLLSELNAVVDAREGAAIGAEPAA